MKNDGVSAEYFFQELAKQNDFTPHATTPSYISIDFLSSQPKTLRDKGFQILRTGDGGFVVLDGTKFKNCYLNLDVSNTIKLETRNDEEFLPLLQAFQTSQEDAVLEQFNILGVYDDLVSNLFGNARWHVGPRGGRRSKFNVYGMTNDKTVLLYGFDGMEELDYTIWTKNHILLFEAKSLPENKGLDIGWHKISYTASRFRSFEQHAIIPVYLLRWPKTAFLFVFPAFAFYQDGIVINNPDAQTPEKVFRVDLP